MNNQAPPDPKSGRGSNATERLQQQFAEITAALRPHFKEFNSRASVWAAEATWKRIILLGLVGLITMAIIGGILGFDESTVQVENTPKKPVTIDIKTDAQGVHVQPTIDGKPGKRVDIKLPDSVTIDSDGTTPPAAPASPASPASPSAPAAPVPPASGKRSSQGGIQISRDGKRVVIDEHGVHVETDGGDAADKTDESAKDDGKDSAAAAKDGKDAAADRAKAAMQRADAAQQRAKAAEARAEAEAKMRDEVRSAIDDAKDDIQQAVNDQIEANGKKTVVRRERFFLWDLLKVILIALFAYLIALKISGNTRRRAEVLVKTASEVAERESLQRQVVEARMQMMQAQVEPHFLFNTLASVDYLIETDPARASTMQKNLIQYLRAALPQMRENSTFLGREVDLVRAYLEILKVRMDERLQVTVTVPDGLRSADFPPMMLQSVVENAIKHGLEPKPEGGSIVVSAEIVDGELWATVADTGMGFTPGGASTSGGGVGLTNIRERLALLYGERGRLVIEANVPAGTRVSIAIPYQPLGKRKSAPDNAPKTEK